MSTPRYQGGPFKGDDGFRPVRARIQPQVHRRYILALTCNYRVGQYRVGQGIRPRCQRCGRAAHGPTSQSAGNPELAVVTPTAASWAGRALTAPMLTSPAAALTTPARARCRASVYPMPLLRRTFAPPGRIAGACEVHQSAADNIHRRRQRRPSGTPVGHGN
jgi:hypothetical protein